MFTILYQNEVMRTSTNEITSDLWLETYQNIGQNKLNFLPITFQNLVSKKFIQNMWAHASSELILFTFQI